MTFKNVLKIFVVALFLFAGGSVFADTFGYDGGSLVAPFSIEDKITGSKFYLPKKSEIQSISAYLDFLGNASTTAGIYNNVGNLVATTTIYENTSANIPDAWYNYTFAENPILEVGNYWLVVWGNNPTEFDDVAVFLEDGSTNNSYQQSYTFNGLPSTYAGGYYTARNIGIYATYSVVPYITIPADFTTSTLAYAGQLFTDLSLVIILTIGLPMGFWVIKKVISLV